MSFRFTQKFKALRTSKTTRSILVDNAGGAVLSWLIEGARKVIAANYQISRPQCVLDAIGSYREGNDWLGNFINECCDREIRAIRQKSGELYRQLSENTVIENGEFVRSTSDFYSALEQAGYKRKRTTQCNVIVGLCIKFDFLD